MDQTILVYLGKEAASCRDQGFERICSDHSVLITVFCALRFGIYRTNRRAQKTGNKIVSLFSLALTAIGFLPLLIGIAHGPRPFSDTSKWLIYAAAVYFIFFVRYYWFWGDRAFGLWTRVWQRVTG